MPATGNEWGSLMLALSTSACQSSEAIVANRKVAEIQKAFDLLTTLAVQGVEQGAGTHGEWGAPSSPAM
jgi:hypothetical protein